MSSWAWWQNQMLKFQRIEVCVMDYFSKWRNNRGATPLAHKTGGSSLGKKGQNLCNNKLTTHPHCHFLSILYLPKQCCLVVSFLIFLELASHLLQCLRERNIYYRLMLSPSHGFIFQIQDDFLPRTATPLEDIFKSIFWSVLFLPWYTQWVYNASNQLI